MNAETNQHIKDFKEMLGKTEEKDQRENTDMWPGKKTADEITTETKKREREEEDITMGEISFGLNTM